MRACFSPPLARQLPRKICFNAKIQLCFHVQLKASSIFIWNDIICFQRLRCRFPAFLSRSYCPQAINQLLNSELPRLLKCTRGDGGRNSHKRSNNNRSSLRDCTLTLSCSALSGTLPNAWKETITENMQDSCASLKTSAGGGNLTFLFLCRSKRLFLDHFFRCWRMLHWGIFRLL